MNDLGDTKILYAKSTSELTELKIKYRDLLADKMLESELAARDQEMGRLRSEMADLKTTLRELMAGMPLLERYFSMCGKNSRVLLTLKNSTIPDNMAKDCELKRLSSELEDLQMEHKEMKRKEMESELADKNLQAELAAKDREIERLTMRVSGFPTCCYICSLHMLM